MSEALKTFLDRCRAQRGADVSLRSVFPGRGKFPTKTRAEVRGAFDKGDVDGVVFDRQRGVFQYTLQPVAVPA